MSRLIDADLLKQNCKCTGGFNDNFMCVDLITLAKVIDNQPTAYDPEKVVEQLETMRMRYYLTYANTGNKTNDEVWEKASMAMDEAITIVKGGGIEWEG